MMGIMGLFVALTETLSCEIEGPRPEHSRSTGQEIFWRLLVQLVTGAEAVVLHARCIDAVRQREKSQI